VECRDNDPAGISNCSSRPISLFREGNGELAQSTRILIADDHPLFRGALRQAVISAVQGVDVVEAGDFDSVSKELEDYPQVDLVLLDLAMPGGRGFSGLLYLRAQHPSVPVVVISAKDDHSVIRRCLDLGTSGFIPKTTDVETMRNAIRMILDGGVWVPQDVVGKPADPIEGGLVRRLSSLTPQQVRVLMMLSQGLLNKQIAYELSVSEATIKAHVSAILQKLGVESRTQAVITAAKIESGQWNLTPEP
jgi:DNA-binding NarL/FixJ family response regulator